MHRRTLLASLAVAGLSSSAASATPGFIVTRDNQKLAYLDRGTGLPVVLVHGWSLGSAIWSLQSDWLAARGVPDEFMAIGLERIKAINAAYDEVARAVAS